MNPAALPVKMPHGGPAGWRSVEEGQRSVSGRISFQLPAGNATLRALPGVSWPRRGVWRRPRGPTEAGRVGSGRPGTGPGGKRLRTGPRRGIAPRRARQAGALHGTRRSDCARTGRRDRSTGPAGTTAPAPGRAGPVGRTAPAPAATHHHLTAPGGSGGPGARQEAGQRLCRPAIPPRTPPPPQGSRHQPLRGPHPPSTCGMTALRVRPGITGPCDPPTKTPSRLPPARRGR